MDRLGVPQQNILDTNDMHKNSKCRCQNARHSSRDTVGCLDTDGHMQPSGPSHCGTEAAEGYKADDNTQKISPRSLISAASQ